MEDTLQNTFDGPAFTIKQFCHHYRISRTGYYRLMERGLAPKATLIVDTARILHRDRMQWEASLRHVARTRLGLSDDPDPPAT
ncbi:hypothetical protein CF70_015110 [Cupriavidus sp. SK-3]|uniref:hypothetical protein n=1 Tax=Cupriavidus sp. SK-3 TaxID=1470558 RepID=UPI00045100B5|nr:hypothetical protein [Cupriavidus sp. SK-3]KDP85187.1 hypothetical protein CF70_015110 [Cupriavidus sp. SK-3]